MRAPAEPPFQALFLATRYGPEPGRFVLTGRRGDAPGWLHPGECWALLTAWNPAGRRRGRRQNQAAQAQLRARLHAYALLETVNGEREDGADWREPALLVFGLRLGAARQLGREFGQLAVLWGCGQRAALVWCGPQDSLPLRRWASTVGGTVGGAPGSTVGPA